MVATLAEPPSLIRRKEIVQLFRQRIQDRRRTKLKKSERETLALTLRDQLIYLAQAETDTPQAIQKLCQNEINLLEEGYPKGTLKSSYLPEYIRLLKAAITSGALPLTEQNSYRDDDGTQRHYALDFLAYALPTHLHLKQEDRATPAEPPTLVELVQYLAAVQELITANEPAQLIAGIAAATGRAYLEVLGFSYFGTTEEGHFNRITLQEHPYLLRFSSSHKESSGGLNILSILPAVDILAAINKLRSEGAIAELEGKSFEAPETQTLIKQVEHVLYRFLGQTGTISLLPETDLISHLRELYLALAVHYFSPQQGEHLFLQRYLGHAISTDSRYLLTHNQTPLTTRGVMIPSQGQLPMHDDESTALPEDPVADESAQAQERIAERAGQEPGLMASLLAVLKQQSETIARLSETIAHLRADLATVLQGQLSGSANHSTLQTLENSLSESRTEQARLHSLAEDYRTRWQETLQRLAQIHSVASPEMAVEPPSLPTHPTTRKKKEKPGRPPADPQQSIVYHRAVRIWALTQQWNRDNDYAPETSIQLSKSLLTRRFGIHAKAIQHFWSNHEAEIEAENERLGLDDGDIHFNKGEKLETYITHVKPILEKEGFYT